MTKAGLWLISSVIIFAAVYFTIASFLIISDKQKKPISIRHRLAFGELLIDYKRLPQLKAFVARDGKQLPYRLYPAQSNNAIILLHGSGWHSQYFLPLAEFITSAGLAKVYTPDLRGHGRSPERRGDIDYIDQLEDDLSDFVAMVRRDNSDSMLIMGGHSSCEQVGTLVQIQLDIARGRE